MCLEESPGPHNGYTYFGGQISLTMIKLQLWFYFTPHIFFLKVFLFVLFLLIIKWKQALENTAEVIWRVDCIVHNEQFDWTDVHSLEQNFGPINPGPINKSCKEIRRRKSVWC